VARKRDRGHTNLPEANIDDNLVPGTPIIIPTNAVVPLSSPLNSTPLPKRAKKAIQPPPPPFDPLIEQEAPHNVSIFMTLVIDDVRKDKTFSKTMDINSTTRDDFDDLRAFLYYKYIREFETIRNLRAHEKPKLSY
jgi:hypothetical protein